MKTKAIRRRKKKGAQKQRSNKGTYDAENERLEKKKTIDK